MPISASFIEQWLKFVTAVTLFQQLIIPYLLDLLLGLTRRE